MEFIQFKTGMIYDASFIMMSLRLTQFKVRDIAAA